MYAQSIAKKFIASYKDNGEPIKYWKKTFYKYYAGCYYPIDDINVKVTGFLQRLIKNANITASLINNTVANIKTLAFLDCPADTWIDDTEDIHGSFDNTICFDNGLVAYHLSPVSSKRVVRIFNHSPEFFTLTKLPYDFSNKAKCSRWLKFLDEIMEGDKERIKLLQQWIKYILGSDLKLQMFLFCMGVGANGKSVFTQVVEYLIGRENCSHILLSNFNSRFSLAYTLNKKLNSTTESAKEISPVAEAMLKAYVAGDSMSFELKYRDTIESVPTAKIMVSTNDRPAFNDRTDSVWRRLIYVPFNVVIPKNQQDKYLVDKLRQELPGIYNWANQADLSNGFSIPRICDDSVEEYKRDINPAKVFLEDYYTYNTLSYVPCTNVYTGYAKYCKDNNYKPLTGSEFGKEVKRVFPSVEKKRKGKDRIAAYIGLRKPKINIVKRKLL